VCLRIKGIVVREIYFTTGQYKVYSEVSKWYMAGKYARQDQQFVAIFHINCRADLQISGGFNYALIAYKGVMNKYLQ